MLPAKLTSRIKAEAYRLGFCLIGVTTPDPPESFTRFSEWVQAGMHGTMDYLAADRSLERRADPRRILSECESILVLAIPYDRPSSPPSAEAAAPGGRVAAYAWNEDYHEVLKPRLQALVAFIESQIGEPVPNRWYTDTGPLLERDLAQRAGLGWIGKNSMLIHPEMGSYFLLAEILLGIELVPDAPIRTDHCGTCTACIDACPTDCITPNRTLDAARCISYLTIELKDSIPLSLRSQIGDWVFGCDICQQVCPWNIRFAPIAGDPAFRPRPALLPEDLREELNLDAEAFNARFKGSPLKRSKRRGYLRNVAVALGNAQQPDSIPVLKKALTDLEPLVRGHAAWALGRIGAELAESALRDSLALETDERVREEILAALSDDPEKNRKGLPPNP
jgi:epoxyqueuosine reductase